MLLDHVRLVRENTTKAVSNLDNVIRLTRTDEKDDSLQRLLLVNNIILTSIILNSTRSI